jgi:cytochrome c peroxidase
MNPRLLAFGLTMAAAMVASSSASADTLDKGESDYELKLLGKYVFFDEISNPRGMSCATCHTPSAGGTHGSSKTNLTQVGATGADGRSVGGLKAPTNAYASFIQPFDLCTLGGVRVEGQQFCGGNFWDGRAEGIDAALLDGATKHIGEEVLQGCVDPKVLGYAKYFGPTSDQALNPMPNPVEQNISRKAVCELVSKAKYAPLYELAWGHAIDCSEKLVKVNAPDVTTPEKAYDISFKRLMLAVGAWQASGDLNSFSSKRDVALRAELACLTGEKKADPKVCKHVDYLNSPGKFPLVGFTAQENLGHDLFYNTAFPAGAPPFPALPVTNCSFCHLSDTEARDGTGLLERYADDAYHNIGVPVNPELPAAPGLGISGHAQIPAPTGAGGFKTPTLRNVDKRTNKHFVKAYTHNGWFKSLESLVHFYNTALVKPRCEGVVTEKVALANGCWPVAEWPLTIANRRLVGALGMTTEHEAALVAYLKTLSDTHTASAPPQYKAEKPKPQPKPVVKAIIHIVKKVVKAIVTAKTTPKPAPKGNTTTTAIATGAERDAAFDNVTEAPPDDGFDTVVETAE